MEKMKKGILVVLLVIVGCLPAMATGAKEGATTGFVDAAVVNPKGVFPIVKEVITISIFNPSPEEQTKPMVEWLEKKMNIKIKWALQGGEGASDKLMIKLASDALDDLTTLTGAANNHGTAMGYAEDHFFYPIGDLVSSYGDTIAQWMQTEPDVFKAMMASDGEIYGIPWRPINFADQYIMRLYIERSWLERLGLKMPTTLDEYVAVLRAFKAKDANGNGDPNDEIPLSATSGRTLTDPTSPLLSPFFDNVDWLQVVNGKVRSAATQESFRGALRFLSSLWKEGLIYPESYSQDRGNQWKTNEAHEGYNVIGSTMGDHLNYTCSWESPRWKTYAYVPPLRGPGGINVAWRPPAHTARLETVISAKTKYPAATFRLLDWLEGEEGALARYYGLEGVHWRRANPGELNVEGKQAVYAQIEGAPEFGLGHFITPYGGTRNFFDTLVAIQRDPLNLSAWGQTKTEMEFASTKEYMKYNDSLADIWPENVIYPAQYRTEVSVLKTNINNLIQESAAKFVTGKLDLDRDWDAFQSELGKAGLERYLTICQESLDRKPK